MKEVWSKAWKKVLIWVSGFAGIIAFAIVGGYTVVKGESEELKRTAKLCFVVTLLFLAAEALVSILLSISGIAHSGGFNSFLEWLNLILLIARIAVYAVFVIMALASARSNGSDSSAAEQAAEEKQAEQGGAEEKGEEGEKGADR